MHILLLFRKTLWWKSVSDCYFVHFWPSINAQWGHFKSNRYTSADVMSTHSFMLDHIWNIKTSHCCFENISLVLFSLMKHWWLNIVTVTYSNRQIVILKIIFNSVSLASLLKLWWYALPRGTCRSRQAFRTRHDTGQTAVGSRRASVCVCVCVRMSKENQRRAEQNGQRRKSKDFP